MRSASKSRGKPSATPPTARQRALAAKASRHPARKLKWSLLSCRLLADKERARRKRERWAPHSCTCDTHGARCKGGLPAWEISTVRRMGGFGFVREILGSGNTAQKALDGLVRLFDYSR